MYLIIYLLIDLFISVRRPVRRSIYMPLVRLCFSRVRHQECGPEIINFIPNSLRSSYHFSSDFISCTHPYLVQRPVKRARARLRIIVAVTVFFVALNITCVHACQSFIDLPQDGVARARGEEGGGRGRVKWFRDTSRPLATLTQLPIRVHRH